MFNDDWTLGRSIIDIIAVRVVVSSTKAKLATSRWHDLMDIRVHDLEHCFAIVHFADPAAPVLMSFRTFIGS